MIFLKGILFLFIYINALRCLGKFITKQDDFLKNLILGYVFYYVFQFALGIIFQALLLNVVVYHYIIGVVLVVLNILSIKYCTFDFKSHIKDYWLIYLLSLVLLYLSVIYVPGNYLANNMDDGYYVTKIFNFIQGININIDPATGFNTKMPLERIINTYELDLASYCFLFKIDVLYFIHYIYTFFNYYFIICVCVGFFECVMNKKAIYGVIGILFFALYPKFFSLLMMAIQDSWQFNTAIWYGSSIVRTVGVFLLFIGYYYYKDDVKKQIVYFILCSITLMSKASQALPMIALLGVFNLFILLFKSNIHKVIKFGMVIAFIGINILIARMVPYTQEIGMPIIGIFDNNIKHFILIIIFALFIYLTYYYRSNKNVLVCNLIVLCFVLCIYVDLLNDFALAFSIHAFVGARTVTLALFTFVVLVAFELSVYLYDHIKYSKQLLIGANILMMIVFMVVSSVYIGKDVFKNVYENPSLCYNTVEKLSKKLGELDIENGDEQLRVIAPLMLFEGKYMVSVSPCLRYYAPDLVVISNETRYPCKDKTNSVSYYSNEYASHYSDVYDGNYENISELYDIVDITDANCIIFRGASAYDYFDDLGFVVYDEIVDFDGEVDYRILYRQ